jgi:hypothetical protein
MDELTSKHGPSTTTLQPQVPVGSASSISNATARIGASSSLNPGAVRITTLVSS